MKSLFLILKISIILALIISCGGGGGGAGGGTTAQGASSSKAFFSDWVEESTGYPYNLEGGDFDTPLTITNTVVYTNADWILYLASEGIPFTANVGDAWVCDYFIAVSGDDSSGVILLDYEGSGEDDLACLQMDNFCDGGSSPCNFDIIADGAGHTYTIINNVLIIDWFGDADIPLGSPYGSDIFR